jgi:glycosyltransferase involved in cell wall biosynthesis
MAKFEIKDMTQEPLISVIVAVYNTEKYITEALDSLFAQGYKNLEVIVVNDGSTDNTLKLLKEYSQIIKIISQENKGQSAARNVGIKCAKGSIIGFLDADDLWPEDHISLSLKYIIDSDYDYVYGQTCHFRVVDNKKETKEPTFLVMSVSAYLYKAKVFDVVGLFDEGMRTGEDLDWTIRLAESSCKGMKIDNTMYLYRRHETNMTNSKELVNKGQLDSYKKKIERIKSNLK